MPRFVEFKLEDGSFVQVNPEHVSLVKRIKDGLASEVTVFEQVYTVAQPDYDTLMKNLKA